MSAVVEMLLASFRNRVRYDAETGCLVWQGWLKENGYAVVEVRAEGKRHRVYAHRFAFQHVLDIPIPEGMDVCHRCDNRACVNVLHLFAGTRKQNMEDCVSKGRQGRGPMLPNTKLREYQIHDIRSDERPHKEISEEFGVGTASISNIKNLVEWAWLPVDPNRGLFVAEGGDRIWGESHYCAKLDEEKVVHIRRSGEPLQVLADRYGVAYNTVHSALTGKTWRRIPVAANENDPRRGHKAP